MTIKMKYGLHNFLIGENFWLHLQVTAHLLYGRCWKMRTKNVLKGHKNPVSFVAWSPDDTKLLTCGNAEVVKLWDVEAGVCLHTFGDQDFVVSSCAWFPDSKRLVCGSSHSEKGDRNQSIKGDEYAKDIRSCHYTGRGEPHLCTFG